MVEVHKKLMGCRLSGLNRLGSNIGKEVEGFKVQIKKLKKDYERIINKDLKNDVDKIILLDGKMMLQKGEEAIDYIYKHGYLGVIERSMNREEICIGRADSGNLRFLEKTNSEDSTHGVISNKSIFEIGTLKGISYNLVEEDLYKYIKRLQRRQENIDKEEIINTFVHSAHLSLNSIDYLKGLCSYPKDFLKCWERYKYGKKEKTEEDILLELEKSMKYE